jgi:hypothetical protein
MGGDDTPSPLHPRGTGVGSTAMTVYYRMMASTPHLTKQPNHPTYLSLSWFPRPNMHVDAITMHAARIRRASLIDGLREPTVRIGTRIVPMRPRPDRSPDVSTRAWSRGSGECRLHQVIHRHSPT